MQDWLLTSEVITGEAPKSTSPSSLLPLVASASEAHMKSTFTRNRPATPGFEFHHDCRDASSLTEQPTPTCAAMNHTPQGMVAPEATPTASTPSPFRSMLEQAPAPAATLAAVLYLQQLVAMAEGKDVEWAVELLEKLKGLTSVVS